jgi:serine/threonine protein kinase
MKGGVVSKVSRESLNDQIHRILSQSTFEYISCGTFGFVFKVTYTGDEPPGFVNPETGEEVREFVMKVQSINVGMSYKGESDHVSKTISWDSLISEVSLQQQLYKTSLEKFGYAVCPAILYYEGLTLNELEAYIKDQFIYKFRGIIPEEHYDSYNVAIILMEFVPSSDLASYQYVPGTDLRTYYRRIQDLKNKAFTIYCMTLLCGINQNDVFGRNFLLDKNDRVTMIDFGVAGDLDKKTITTIEGLVYACHKNLSDRKTLRDLKQYLIRLDHTLEDWLFQKAWPQQPYGIELLEFPHSLPEKVIESCKSGLCHPTNTEPKRITKRKDRYDYELEAREQDKLAEEAAEAEESDKKRRGGKRRTKYVGTRRPKRVGTRRKV